RSSGSTRASRRVAIPTSWQRTSSGSWPRDWPSRPGRNRVSARGRDLMRLSESVASARTLAMFGLAKNAGKTEALMAVVRELRDLGQVVGVTSIGRDGEALDVIDSKICKPSIYLTAGSLVATTDWLLQKSGLGYDLLQRTPYRTPLGRVLIGR